MQAASLSIDSDEGSLKSYDIDEDESAFEIPPLPDFPRTPNNGNFSQFVFIYASYKYL